MDAVLEVLEEFLNGLEQEFMIVSRSADMGSLTNFSQRSIGANEGSTTTVFASIDNDSLLDHYSGALHFDS